MFQQIQKKRKTEVDEDQCIEKFDNYLRTYKDIVDSTIKTHHIYLRRFFNWFHKYGLNSLEELNFENLNLFLSQYHSKYSLVSTRKLHFSLRSFFDFCRLESIIKYDFRPILPQKRIYTKSFVPAVLTKAEIKLLITNAQKDKSNKGKRDYAMLLLLICYGVRGCQVRDLELSDIDWNRNLILFKASKNGNAIEQAIIPEIGNALVDYIINIRPESSCSKLFLSMSNSSNGLANPSVLSSIMGKLLDNAGIDIPHNALRGSHLFRHTFASQLLAEGEPIKNISDMLGHKYLSTTAIYTKIDINNLKQVCLEWREVK